MSKKMENTGFICENCGKEVPKISNGSYRNHCPFCLCSKHVDNKPGDRASECGGIMEPISADYHFKKGIQIVHKCKKCGHVMKNMTATETENEDDFDMVMKLMQ